MATEPGRRQTLEYMEYKLKWNESYELDSQSGSNHFSTGKIQGMQSHRQCCDRFSRHCERHRGLLGNKKPSSPSLIESSTMVDMAAEFECMISTEAAPRIVNCDRRLLNATSRRGILFQS